MSSAAKPPQSAAQSGSSGGASGGSVLGPAYIVARPAGQCAVTGEPIAPEQKFMALLRETPTGLERIDVSLPAWPQVDHAGAIAYWQTAMPKPGETKRKPLVDDEVLMQLFERLADTEEEQKQHFRFVLGLILMRKRLLAYEGTDKTATGDEWILKPRGRDERMRLLDPKLTEEQTKAVAEQLGQIMNEEL